MRDFIKKVPTSSIVLLIIAAFLIIWGSYQAKLGSGDKVFNEAVTLEKAEYMSENEGKYVLFNAKPEVDEPPADPLTGVTCDGFVLRRKVEMYQYVYNYSTDTVTKDFSDEQLYNIEGSGGELYENPAFPAELEDVAVIGEASAGGFKLSQRYLASLADGGVVDSESNVTQFSGKLPEFENAYKLKPVGDVYTNGDPGAPEIGDIRISYEYIPADAFDTLMFFGRQQNGYIGTENEDDEIFMSDSMTKAEDISTVYFSTYKDTAKGMFVISGILIVAAVLIYFVRNRKKGGA